MPAPDAARRLSPKRAINARLGRDRPPNAHDADDDQHTDGEIQCFKVLRDSVGF
jgi:hypothetical protein